MDIEPWADDSMVLAFLRMKAKKQVIDVLGRKKYSTNQDLKRYKVIHFIHKRNRVGSDPLRCGRTPVSRIIVFPLFLNWNNTWMRITRWVSHCFGCSCHIGVFHLRRINRWASVRIVLDAVDIAFCESWLFLWCVAFLYERKEHRREDTLRVD